MAELTADSLEALNKHLAALDAVGVVVTRDSPRRRREAAAEVLRLVRAGNEAAVAIEEPAFQATPGYQRLIRSWAAGVPLDQAIEAVRRESRAVSADDSRLTRRLAYPLVVAAVGCCGVAILSRTILPVIESAYADLRRPVGPVVTTLQELRQTTPVWLLLALVLLGLIYWALVKSTPFRWSRSGVSRGPRARRRYGQLGLDSAAYLEAGATSAYALQLAGLANGASPPLLEWATGQEASAAELRAIGRLYGEDASRGSKAAQDWIPFLAIIAIGGGAVLGYTLALFGPIIELLTELAI